MLYSTIHKIKNIAIWYKTIIDQFLFSKQYLKGKLTICWVFLTKKYMYLKIYRSIKLDALAAESFSWAILRKGCSFINTEKFKIIGYLVPQHWWNAFSYPTPSEFFLLQGLVWTLGDGSFCELGHQSCHRNHSGPQCPQGSPDLCPHPASPGVWLSS